MADTEQEPVPTATSEEEAGTLQPEESPVHVDPEYKEEKTEEEDKGLVEEIMAAVDRRSPPKDAEESVEKEEPSPEPPVDEVTVETEIKEVEEPSVAPVVEEKKKDVLIVPHLLTDEEISAKGVPDTEIDCYRWFHLRQRYNPNNWYNLLREHTFHSEFITLSSAEIDVLYSSCHGCSDDPPELSQEQNDILEQLKQKIETSITKFGDTCTGILIKLNTRGVEDALMERNDTDVVQEVQDAIRTELEIEQQFANAYLIWRSWRSSSFRDSETSQTRGANVLRRSLRRIQRSFSRSHVQSESSAVADKEKSSNEDPLAEETANKEEEEAKTDDSPPEEAPPTEEVPAPLSVEVTVEDNKAEETEPQTSTETEPQTTTETEPQTTTETELPETTEPAIETEPQASTEIEPQTTAETDPQAIAETKPQDVSKEEPEIQEIKKDDDIERKPRSLFKKSDQSEEHQILRVKKETQQNKILRAFIRTICARLRVSTGTEALKLLCTSSRVKEELQQVKKFIDVEGTEAVLALTCWSGVEVARYPGMRFRGFVYQNNLTALTQVDDVLYIPNVSRFKQTIQKKIEYFFNNSLKEALQSQQDSYIVDLFIAPNKIYVLEMYPFHTSTGACLYTWQQCQKQLMNGPFEFRHVHTPFKHCFSGLLPHWQQVCEAVAQERRSEDRHHNKCILL